jgi:diaminopimelate decarboxylase
VVKKVSVTLSTSFRSIVRGRQLPATDQTEIRRLISYRDSCAPAEVSFPAAVLRDGGVARWLRDHRLAIDVRALPELYAATSVGIHPGLITVHADGFGADDIRCVGAVGVGRVVLSCSEHIASLGSATAGHPQNVLLRMTDALPPAVGRRQFVFDSDEADAAAGAVMNHRTLTLIGLQCEIGTAGDDFVSYPAAIGNMIAQMDRIRHRHGVVLTRLGLDGGRLLVAADSSVVRRDIAEEIDAAVDDACATLRFPRPAIVICAGAQVIGQRAA